MRDFTCAHGMRQGFCAIFVPRQRDPVQTSYAFHLFRVPVYDITIYIFGSMGSPITQTPFMHCSVFEQFALDSHSLNTWLPTASLNSSGIRFSSAKLRYSNDFRFSKRLFPVAPSRRCHTLSSFASSAHTGNSRLREATCAGAEPIDTIGRSP